MQKITIAFDVDGTLRNNVNDNSQHPMLDEGKYPIANEEIRTLLIILSKFKNVEILVWSGGGELYARQICSSLGISKYVSKYAGKWITQEDGMGVRNTHPTLKPHVAIDDIHDCILGDINLICKQKLND